VGLNNSLTGGGFIRLRVGALSGRGMIETSIATSPRHLHHDSDHQFESFPGVELGIVAFDNLPWLPNTDIMLEAVESDEEPRHALSYSRCWLARRSLIFLKFFATMPRAARAPIPPDFFGFFELIAESRCDLVSHSRSFAQRVVLLLHLSLWGFESRGLAALVADESTDGVDLHGAAKVVLDAFRAIVGMDQRFFALYEGLADSVVRCSTLIWNLHEDLRGWWRFSTTARRP
jgi:hypothetical protein